MKRTYMEKKTKSKSNWVKKFGLCQRYTERITGMVFE